MEMTKLKGLLDNFFELESQIHRAFGYKEDWVKIPLSDHRDCEWALAQEEDGSGEIIMEYEHNGLTEDNVRLGQCVSYRIYTQRFLPRWVYETKEFTLISVATGVDGNHYIAVYDNKKRITDPAIVEAAKKSTQELIAAARRSH
jgi:hypothetical protein